MKNHDQSPDIPPPELHAIPCLPGTQSDMSAYTILIVEDENVFADMITKMLSQNGLYPFFSRRVSCLEEALACHDDRQYDVVLCDLNLPDSTGIDTFNTIFERYSNTAIVVLTGVQDEQLAVSLLTKGAQDYLIKNEITTDRILHALRFAIERKKHETNFKNLITYNADGIIIVSSDGRLVFVNPAAEALFKSNASSMLGTYFGFPLTSKKNTEIQFNTNGSHPVIVEMNVVEITWHGHQAYLASLRDVTKRNQLEASLQKTVDELKKANIKILQQQKSVIEEERLNLLLQMSAATAHQMNQPLTVLLAGIDLMRYHLDQPGLLQEDMDRINKAGRCLADIVKKMDHTPVDGTKPYIDDLSIYNTNRNISILAVEDSSFFFHMEKKIITDLKNASLVQARSIKEALCELQGGTFDIILLDHFLPDGNAIDFLKKIRPDYGDVPVVVISAQSDETVISQVIHEGAYDYLSKNDINKGSLYRCINNALEKARLKNDIKNVMSAMARMTMRDELTGLYNRQFYMDALEREIHDLSRHESDLSVVLLDMDDLKSINTIYSHAAGDMVISHVAKMFDECLSPSDLVSRFCGEKFSLILRSTTERDALSKCERFRKMVADHEFQFKSLRFHTSVSGGVTQPINHKNASAETVLAQAEYALARAKRDGGNNICSYSDILPHNSQPCTANLP